MLGREGSDPVGPRATSGSVRYVTSEDTVAEVFGKVTWIDANQGGAKARPRFQGDC